MGFLSEILRLICQLFKTDCQISLIFFNFDVNLSLFPLLFEEFNNLWVRVDFDLVNNPCIRLILGFMHYFRHVPAIYLALKCLEIWACRSPISLRSWCDVQNGGNSRHHEIQLSLRQVIELL